MDLRHQSLYVCKHSGVAALIHLVWVWTFWYLLKTFGFKLLKLLWKSDFSLNKTNKACGRVILFQREVLTYRTLIGRLFFRIKMFSNKTLCNTRRKDWSCELFEPHTEHREVTPEAFKTNSCATSQESSRLNGIGGCLESLTSEPVSKQKDVRPSSVSILWKLI